jgi:hypothetical protein
MAEFLSILSEEEKDNVKSHVATDLHAKLWETNNFLIV